MLLALISLAHFSTSASMKALNCGCVIVIGLAPCSSQAFLMAGLETILLISLLSFSTIAGGVPAGAMKPTHKVAWKPFTPASSSVGTSGRMAERFWPVVAMARTNRAWTIGA